VAAERLGRSQRTVPITGWRDLEPPQREFVEGFRRGLAEFGFSVIRSVADRRSHRRGGEPAGSACGTILLPRPNYALDAFLRWPEAEVGFSGSRRIHPPERVAQEVELALPPHPSMLQVRAIRGWRACS
jgi:hypothetical protein